MIKEKRIDLKAISFEEGVRYYREELGYSQERAERLVGIARNDGKSEIVRKKNGRTIISTF
jgi:hypothetical protein